LTPIEGQIGLIPIRQQLFSSFFCVLALTSGLSLIHSFIIHCLWGACTEGIKWDRYFTLKINELNVQTAAQQ
jgi:hypothetical protein